MKTYKQINTLESSLVFYRTSDKCARAPQIEISALLLKTKRPRGANFRFPNHPFDICNWTDNINTSVLHTTGGTGKKFKKFSKKSFLLPSHVFS